MGPLASGCDPMLARIAAPALTAFLYSSTVDHGSLVVGMLAHPVVSGLGRYALEAYLFQEPLRNLFTWCFAQWLPLESAHVFVAYLLLLWIVAALYVDRLLVALDGWMHTSMIPSIVRWRYAWSTWHGGRQDANHADYL